MIDVCIVTYRNQETIGSVLASIEEHIPGARVSIWDNSPDDLTARAIEAFVGETRLGVRSYHDGKNIGFGHACNELAKLSLEDWLIFLNPDAEVRAWPADDPELSASRLTGAAVYLLSGALQDTFGRDRNMWREFNSRVLRRRDHSTLGSGRTATDFVSGAAFVVNRQRFLDCGGFDSSKYFMYYEDLDLGRRWRQLGGTVEIDPRWKVSHIGGFSAKTNHALALVRSFESARAYHRRWSRASSLFRPICIIEALMKLVIALPSGQVGATSLSTQSRFVRYLLTGRPVGGG